MKRGLLILVWAVAPVLLIGPCASASMQPGFSSCDAGIGPRPCDVICTGSVCANASDTIKSCAGGPNIGKFCTGNDGCPGSTCAFDGVVYCGLAATQVINGGNSRDIICTGNVGNGFKTVQGKGGDDLIAVPGTVRDDQGVIVDPGAAGAVVIDAGAGNDTVYGGPGFNTITAGDGNDAVYGGPAGNSLRGGNGNDQLFGQLGDDVIFGDAGSDIIIGQGGRDVLKGGDGDDFVFASFNPFTPDGTGGPSDNGVLGTILCGEGGNDFLFGGGPGHQCMDGGGEQNPAPGESDCTYANVPDDTDPWDVGTATGCASPSKISTNGQLLPRSPGCGCQN